MEQRIVTILDDRGHPGKDIFGRGINTRQHYLHCIMALASDALGPTEIGHRAKRLAKLSKYRRIRPNTFSQQVTESHLLNYMKKQGLARPLNGKWKLTAKAKKLLMRAVGH